MLRCDEDTKIHLMKMGIGKASRYVRDLITKDRFEQMDEKILDQREQELKDELKEIADLRKTSKESLKKNKEQIHECIQYWHNLFKDRMFKDAIDMEKAVERRVMPNLKKLGYPGTAQDITKLFLEWPEEGE